MLWTIYFKKTNNLGGWANPISTFDDYEPDNSAEMTININRHIQINQIQERNFHQQWNRVGGYGYTTQCDVDWVRFVAPCSSNFEVFTSAIPNRTNANTRLTLFDNNLVQLAQNDDISPTNQFSSIQFNFVAGAEYFIRVENMSNLVTGYYTLQIGRFSIQGNSQLCSPSTYTVQNLPTGASVTWSATPSGIVSFNPVGPTTNPSTTITRVIDGNVTITATINNCGNQFTLNMPVVVGAAINGYYIISSNYHQPIQRPLYQNNSPIWLPANQSFGVTAYVTNSNPVSPSWTRAASSYPFNWGSSGVQLNFSGTSGSSAYNQRNGIFNFTANTGCGTATTTFTWPVIVQGWGFRVAVNPNPASDNLIVSITDESKEVKALSQDETVTLTLYNLNSTIIVKRWTFKNNQARFNLNVSDVKMGHYILVAQKGKHQQSEQIFIE
ncbi:MAG: T9SS type A sorting domain-containing protein [Bacteroidota bacterium]